jgi:signal transduction histidine kinase
MLNMAPVGMAICEEPSSGRMRLNRLGAAILGVDEDADIPWRANEAPFIFYQGQQLLAAEQMPFERVARTREAIHAEPLCVVRPDGQRRDIELTAWPVLDRHGEVASLVAMFRDVTARNREQEMREFQQAMVMQGAIYALLEADLGKVVQDLIARVPTALNVRRAELWCFHSETQQILLDVTAGSGGTETVADGASTDGSQAAYVLAAGAPVIVADSKRENRFAYPRYLREAGLVSSLNVVLKIDGRAQGVLSAHDGQTRHFFPYETNFLQSMADLLAAILVRQKHEIGVGESQRRKALAEAEQRMRQAERLASLGTLAAGIAHEVNNPLNAIMMNAELALISLQAVDNRERLARMLETIIKEAKRGGSITRNVLQFSTADRFTPKDRANLKTVLEKVRQRMAPVLQKYGSELELKIDDALPELAINQIAIEQAMANLITNAAQAKASHIWLMTERFGEHAHITVRDDGSGISQEDLPHVFDPFYTTRRQKGGSGLGLSLVHRIITDHDGTIDVSSASGKGAEFVVRLPLPREDQSPAGSA